MRVAMSHSGVIPVISALQRGKLALIVLSSMGSLNLLIPENWLFVCVPMVKYGLGVAWRTVVAPSTNGELRTGSSGLRCSGAELCLLEQARYKLWDGVEQTNTTEDLGKVTGKLLTFSLDSQARSGLLSIAGQMHQSDACVWTCSAAKSVFQNENIHPSEMAEDFF